VGYIAIGVDEEHNMLNFPSKYAKGDIDLGDTLTSIDLQWYLYNTATGQYQEVDSSSNVFLDVVDYLEVALTDYDTSLKTESFDIGNDTEPGDISISTTHITPSAYTWKLASAAGSEALLSSVCVTYELYGVRFKFDLRN